jgi:hypothetical protein
MPEYYIGMDVHKRTISFLRQTRRWRPGQTRPYSRAPRFPHRVDGSLARRSRPVRMEATLTSHWAYDHLRELGCDAKMGHALRMKAIAAGKHSNDKLDAATISDLLPTQFFYPELRREQLRFRNLW